MCVAALYYVRGCPSTQKPIKQKTHLVKTLSFLNAMRFTRHTHTAALALLLLAARRLAVLGNKSSLLSLDAEHILLFVKLFVVVASIVCFDTPRNMCLSAIVSATLLGVNEQPPP